MSHENVVNPEPAKPVVMPDDVRSYFAERGLRLCPTFGNYTRDQLTAYLDGKLEDGSRELDEIFEGAPDDLKERAVQYAIDAGYARTERPETPPEEGGIKLLKHFVDKPPERRGFFGR